MKSAPIGAGCWAGDIWAKQPLSGYNMTLPAISRVRVGLQSAFMSHASQAITRTPAEVVRLAPVTQASNGICYAVMGEVTNAVRDLERMVTAGARAIAAGVRR